MILNTDEIQIKSTRKLTSKQQAFQHLKNIIDTLPPFPDDFDPEKEKDKYFTEKYGINNDLTAIDINL